MITIQRTRDTGLATMGTLTLDSNPLTLCTLERDAVELAAGTYQACRYRSEHFDRDVVRLLDVPGRDGIEIHPGNYPAQTKGCILVGLTAGEDFVNNSVTALTELMACLPTDATPFTVQVNDPA